ncbi:Immunity protein 52 [Stigmatella aurantiaca]|uniref:Immunity protein 52 n=1 Tax=Stigmatella aurantiaca TaxID=41 RepID=A0A1H8FL53_STIAU|nr:Imm52 family immunity protein [Stigmatella aurantiaca]SEN31798.1 Immunity protein 52 [Stigmatella aurantiaca]
MLEKYHVGAYWKKRPETASECARRLELFFHMLTRCDVSLHQWYTEGRVTRDSPGTSLPWNDREFLEKRLLQGRNRTDLGKKVIPELGFRLHTWNQRPDGRSTRLNLVCGCYSEQVSNVCLLYPPIEGETVERMLAFPTLHHVLESMITAWEPQWGLVTTQDTRDALNPDPSEVDIGWITYLAREQGTVPPLPAPVSIQPVGSLGMLIILTPERFSASNPEHIALGRRVRELLARAGLLDRRDQEILPP